MYKKPQKVYICCTATKCSVYYTKPQKRIVWETNLKEHHMFEFEKQYKQFEELADRIKEVNEFWINLVVSSFKDLSKKTK